jgi:hypothetical protein
MSLRALFAKQSPILQVIYGSVKSGRFAASSRRRGAIARNDIGSGLYFHTSVVSKDFVHAV